MLVGTARSSVNYASYFSAVAYFSLQVRGRGGECSDLPTRKAQRKPNRCFYASRRISPVNLQLSDDTADTGRRRRVTGGACTPVFCTTTSVA